jgi:hypothetical protein
LFTIGKLVLKHVLAEWLYHKHIYAIDLAVWNFDHYGIAVLLLLPLGRAIVPVYAREDRIRLEAAVVFGDESHVFQVHDGGVRQLRSVKVRHTVLVMLVEHARHVAVVNRLLSVDEIFRESSRLLLNLGAWVWDYTCYFLGRIECCEFRVEVFEGVEIRNHVIR